MAYLNGDGVTHLWKRFKEALGALTAQDVGALPSSTAIPSKTSELNNDSGFVTKNDIPAIPVQSVNGKTGAVNLTASDVGARASNWMPTAADIGAMASNKITMSLSGKTLTITTK